MRRIYVNGREYRSPEEMPPEVRRLYERTRGGLEGGGLEGGDLEGGKLGGAPVLEVEADEGGAGDGGGREREPGDAPPEPLPDPAPDVRRIVFNGEEFSDPEDLPPDARRLYAHLMTGMARDLHAGAGPGLGPEPGEITHESVEITSRTFELAEDGDAPPSRDDSERPDWVKIAIVALAVLVVLHALLT